MRVFDFFFSLDHWGTNKLIVALAPGRSNSRKAITVSPNAIEFVLGVRYAEMWRQLQLDQYIFGFLRIVMTSLSYSFQNV